MMERVPSLRWKSGMGIHLFWNLPFRTSALRIFINPSKITGTQTLGGNEIRVIGTKRVYKIYVYVRKCMRRIK